MAVYDIEVDKHAETAAVVGNEGFERRGHTIEGLDAGTRDGCSQFVHYLGMREDNAAQLAVLRLVLGMFVQLAVHFLELCEEVREIAASSVQLAFVGKGGRRCERGILYSVGFQVLLLVSRQGSVVLDKGAVIHEERAFYGQQHLLRGGRAEAQVQPMVSQESNGRPVAFHGMRMAGEIVAERRDAAHNQRCARVLEPAVGLENDSHRELLVLDCLHLCSLDASGCANVQRFFPASLPRYSARSTSTKFSANVRSGS